MVVYSGCDMETLRKRFKAGFRRGFPAPIFYSILGSLLVFFLIESAHAVFSVDIRIDQPGIVTFGQVIPQGRVPRGRGLRLGAFPTQTDIKTTWLDGSIRFAVVTARATAGTFQLVDSNPSGPAFPNAQAPAGTSVSMNIGGTVYTATLPRAPTNDVWLSGPLVHEWRRWVTPVAPGNIPHSFLRVLFDYRAFNDGTGRLDVTVENALNQPDATMVTYDCTMRINNVIVYQENALPHFYMARFRKVFDVGQPGIGAATANIEAAVEANAIPLLWSGITSAVQEPVDPNQNPAYRILTGPGVLKWNMDDHGGWPSIGPYPDWVARYWVHKNPIQLKFILQIADLAASWPLHIRENDVTDPSNPYPAVDIDRRPNFWFDPEPQGEDKPQGFPIPPRKYTLGPEPPTPPYSPLVQDNGHTPAHIYPAYLATGDRFYADEMLLWANYGLLSAYQDRFYNARGGSAGFLIATNESRAFAWSLRNITDAAAYLPDGYPLKSYFAEKVNNNLSWSDSFATNNRSPLGVAWPGADFHWSFEGDPNQRYAWLSQWMLNYLAWALDHANKQGFPGGTVWRNQIMQWQVNFAVHPTHWVWSAPYRLPVARRVPPGSYNLESFRNLDEVVAALDDIGEPMPMIDFYGKDARLMCVIGSELNVAGSQVCLDRLTPIIEDEFRGLRTEQSAGWAIMPRITQPSPPRFSQQPANTSSELGYAAQLVVQVEGNPFPTIQWERSDDGGANYRPINGANSATYTIDRVSQADDGAMFRCVAQNEVDTAISNEVTLTVTADLTPPTALVTNLSANSPLKATVPLTGTAEDLVGVASVAFYYGDEIINTDDTPPYQVSWNTTGATDGPYDVWMVAYDLAGNPGYSESVPVIADNTAPSISITSHNPDQPVSETITISADASDALTGVVHVEFFHEGTLIDTVTEAPYQVQWNTTERPNGRIRLTVEAYDGAGNKGVSSVNVTVSNSVPAIGVTFPQDNAWVGGTEVTWRAETSGVPAATRVKFFLNDAEAASVSGSSPFVYTWDSTPLEDGLKTLRARSYDGETELAQTSLIRLQVDNTAPAVQFTSPQANAPVAGTIDLVADATDGGSGVSQVEFYAEGTLLGIVRTPPYKVSWNTTPVVNNLPVLRVVAKDQIGNQRSQTISVRLSNDNTGPQITNIRAIEISASEARILWETNERARGRVKYGLTTSYGLETPMPSSFETAHNHLIGNLQPGQLYNCQVESRDEAGNVSLSSNFTFTTLNSGPNNPPVESPTDDTTIFPNPCNRSLQCRQIQITTKRPNIMKLSIYNIRGNLIQELEGNGTFLWNLKHKNGEEVPAGIYMTGPVPGKAVLIK